MAGRRHPGRLSRGDLPSAPTAVGHLWTLRGYLGRALRAPRPPASTPWAVTLDDPDLGAVRLSGSLSRPETASPALVVLVHGLGGSSDSPYVREMAIGLTARGLACLRLNLRGADRSGEDIYHAGLTDDLLAALASPEVAAFDRVGVLGFSLGGHVALRLAVDGPPSSVRAVAAISPPVDLAATARTIDSPGRWLYRRYLLARLGEIYAEVAERRGLPARDVAAVRRARTFVEFDSLVIAPRYGFDDAWDYYRQVSVGTRLEALALPALIVASVSDPMVPAASFVEPLQRADRRLHCHWAQPGGHLGFPSALDLGADAEPGLEAQVAGWLHRQLTV